MPATKPETSWTDEQVDSELYATLSKNVQLPDAECDGSTWRTEAFWMTGLERAHTHTHTHTRQPYRAAAPSSSNYYSNSGCRSPSTGCVVVCKLFGSVLSIAVSPSLSESAGQLCDEKHVFEKLENTYLLRDGPQERGEHASPRPMQTNN